MSELAKYPIWKKLLIIIPIVIGIIIFSFLKKQDRTPKKKPIQEESTLVRVITVPSVQVIPKVLAYGTVKPASTWQAIAEVSGKLQFVHKQLKVGAILKKGTLLAQVDPTDYVVGINQQKANIQSIQAQIDLLVVKEQNYQASLQIEQNTLQVAEKEFRRLTRLAKRGAGSQKAVDQQKITVLSQRTSIQNLKNNLNLIPVDDKILQAQKLQAESKLKSAELSLKRTKIYLPFSARVSEVKVDRQQFVGQGSVLASFDGIKTAEIAAQIEVSKMARLLADVKIAGRSYKIDPKKFKISAVVRLHSGNFIATWPARIVRTSDSVDSQTRTIGVIVAVDKPYFRHPTIRRPPLTKNMFVEVELSKISKKYSIIIPRSAYNQGFVYIVNSQQRLEKRKITILFQQDNFIVVKSGIERGEKLVISQLVPAIEGMLLQAQNDQKATKAMIQTATGKGEL
ncbi:MAG: multidrug efflux pump subunit AcrA (membrane-fusion protein) [bacterium]|jgi:multidrug efflux pump subunit AcrA (membrane-fusion protein)